MAAEARPGGAARRRWRTALVAIVPTAAAAWVWYPILTQYFYGDDLYNLFLICNAPWLEYLFTPHAGHVELVRNAIFYASARFFGTDAARFFATVWLMHLVNVALLYLTVVRLSGSAAIACTAAVVFGTCPVLAGSLGWYSVFGHVLVGTTLLLILCDAAGHVRRGVMPGRLRQGLWLVVALAGAASFGVGVGTALALPFALALLLVHSRFALPLWPLLPAVPALYLTAYWLYARLGPVTPLVQSGILQTDVPLLLQAPRFTTELIAYAVDRMLAGPFPLPPYPHQAGLVLAAAFAATAAWSAARGPRLARRLALAGTMLTLACFATIGLGRVVLLELMPRAEAIGQLRYYYVGVLTLALVLAAILIAIAAAAPRLRPLGTILLAPVLAVWMLALWVRPPPLDDHAETRADMRFLVNYLRVLARQTPPGSNVYVVNRNVRTMSPYFYTRRDFPGLAAVFSIYFPEPTIMGRRVLFIEEDPSVREAHRTARRLLGALIAPEDVPPGPPPLTAADGMCLLPEPPAAG